MKSRTVSIVLAGAVCAVLICAINATSAFAADNHAVAELRSNDEVIRGHHKTQALDIAPTSVVVLDTLFYEDWESGIGNWRVSMGVWEVGIPTVGPDSTHSGQNCAGTILGGNYPNGANTRLISDTITLPSLPPGERIRLKFWHWFLISSGDNGYVEIIMNGDTITIAGPFSGTSPIWTQVYVDLSAYADSTVRIAFHFTSDGYAYHNGWYVDDIVIIKGPPAPFNSPEDFEQGIDDWWVSMGVWEVGIPTVGPDSTHSGQNCAGTILGGNYPNGANTRLISPDTTLPSLPPGERIRLKFWHWFLISSGDNGYVEIIMNGDTITIAGPFSGTSPIWTQVYVDLSAYADSTVRIAFHFTSDGYAYHNGWYVDDIEIIRGPVTFNNPEDFEQGIGDWWVDNGVWEVGIPTVGPDSAHSVPNCAGTILGGNYPNGANTRLISPEITLTPENSINPNIKLDFWHWFLISDGDNGYVQVSANGSNWDTIAGPFFGPGSNWSPPLSIDLSAYADSTVRIAFYFTSDGYAYNNGWYVDDISITGIILGVNEPAQGTHVTKSVILYQNHPNPFRPTTEIRYTLSRDCDVKLEVFNLLGQKVATLVDQKQSAGYKSVRWDASSFSAGIYFYRLRAGDFTAMKKMVITK